jgi:hypothetical protein
MSPLVFIWSKNTLEFALGNYNVTNGIWRVQSSIGHSFQSPAWPPSNTTRWHVAPFIGIREVQLTARLGSRGGDNLLDNQLVAGCWRTSKRPRDPIARTRASEPLPDLGEPKEKIQIVVCPRLGSYARAA